MIVFLFVFYLIKKRCSKYILYQTGMRHTKVCELSILVKPCICTKFLNFKLLLLKLKRENNESKWNFSFLISLCIAAMLSWRAIEAMHVAFLISLRIVAMLSWRAIAAMHVAFYWGIKHPSFKTKWLVYATLSKFIKTSTCMKILLSNNMCILYYIVFYLFCRNWKVCTLTTNKRKWTAQKPRRKH